MTDIRVKRIDDRSLHQLFSAALSAGSEVLERHREAGNLNGIDIRLNHVFSTALPWPLSDEDLQAAPAGQFTIARAAITLTGQAGGNRSQNSSVTFEYRRGDGEGLVDTFAFSQSGGGSGPLNTDAGHEIMRSIHTALSPVIAPVAVEDGGLVPTLSNLAEAFNTTYQRIAEELSSAVAHVAAERSAQLRDFTEERAALREEIAAERSAMHEEVQREIEAEKEDLKRQREEIAQEFKKLEISSHKDARRKQFLKLQEELEHALATPIAGAGLRKMRWAVFWVLTLTGIFAGIFAYGSITAAAEHTAVNAANGWVLPAIRSFILTFASLSAFVGAAAWLRYFYVRDMQSHEELLRFRNDMARASWVMDAALEIRKEHEEEIPIEWITGVTQGLFASKRKDTLEEGAQALAALMGLSASATIGPGGTTVELGKKGGKALAAAMRDRE